MSLYSVNQEQRIRILALLRKWQRFGFLTDGQKLRLDDDVQVDLRRTNVFLRMILFVFTAIIIGAVVGLIVVVFNLEDREPAAVLTAACGIVCFVLADRVASRFRLYHFGVEEALAVSSVSFLAVCAAIILNIWRSTSPSSMVAVVALSVGALGAAGLYKRFGYVYAALGAIACCVAIPFQLNLSWEMERIVAALICAIVFAAARKQRLAHGDDFPGDHYSILQSMAWAGIYAALNLKLTFGFSAGAFYWWTYLMVWLLPVLGLRWAVRDKDRLFLDFNIGMLLVTLLTNKPYLGLDRQPWDPLIFGLFLITGAVLIRRWLLKGPESRRNGYTPDRVLADDQRGIDILGAASVVLPLPTPHSAPVTPEPNFGGGRSGGAGASGQF